MENSPSSNVTDSFVYLDPKFRGTKGAAVPRVYITRYLSLAFIYGLVYTYVYTFINLSVRVRDPPI